MKWNLNSTSLLAITLTIGFLMSSVIWPQDSPKPGANLESDTEPFTIKGFLEDSKGDPVVGQTVYCFIFRSGAVYAQLGMVGEKIVPINPKGITDKKGYFEIKVDSDFIRRDFELTKQYAIGIYRDSKPLPVGIDKFPAVFDLELVRKAKQVVNIGKIVLNPK